MPVLAPAQVRAQALPALQGGADDALIASLIERADALIAAEIGIPPVSASAAPTLAFASYTLYTGEGLVVSEDGRRLRSSAAPIASVTSIYDDPEEVYGASTLVASSDYAVSADGREIRLKPAATHGAWTTADRAVRAIVSAGWTVLPPALIGAVSLTVQHLLSQRAGIQDQIDGAGVRIVNQRRPIPREVLIVLNQYRDWPGMVA